MYKPFIILALLITSTAASQQRQDLTVERVFNSQEFASERFGPARWVEDGDGYTTLERSDKFEGASDIVRYETKSGERSILVSAEDLVPGGTELPLSIRDYTWSNNRNMLMIFTNTQRVWRRHTRGDYWVLNLSTKILRQIGKDYPESSLMFAKFSPDDKKIGYVSKHNIYVEDLESGKITTITSDGTDKLINGTFDWAYEEEFGCRDGFRWSPDSKSIAYWQIDASDIRVFNMINNTDSIYSFEIPIQYPKVGEDPSSCKIGVVSATGGETTWLPIPGDSKQNYLPRMMWSPDSKSIMSQQINRKQNTNKLWSYSVASNEVKNVFTDKDEE